MFLHLHQSAIQGAGGVGRVENTRSPVTVEQIRDWCGHPDAQVVVKPVLDLADHVHVEAYEVPDRIAEPVALRDGTCVFPWCTRPARRLRADDHPCDCDHVVPHGREGPTCSCNLAPLCRRHHRLKTHGGWTYTILEPGTYLWSSPAPLPLPPRPRPAPSTSPATDAHPHHHPTSSHPAPHPAHRRGQWHVRM